MGVQEVAGFETQTCKKKEFRQARVGSWIWMVRSDFAEGLILQ